MNNSQKDTDLELPVAIIRVNRNFLVKERGWCRVDKGARDRSMKSSLYQEFSGSRELKGIEVTFCERRVWG